VNIIVYANIEACGISDYIVNEKIILESRQFILFRG